MQTKASSGISVSLFTLPGCNELESMAWISRFLIKIFSYNLQENGKVNQTMSDNNYNESNIDTMEMVYGKGYLSAGGDAEVLKILSAVDIRGKRVLDIGCGLGGACVAMAKNLNPQRVVGFDIDPVVLDRAQKLIEEKHLQDIIELVSGVAGPLPFEDSSFDVVYVTAVSCHMPDLSGFFQDVHRVLKPGGYVLGSEWMIKENNAAYRGFDDLLRQRGLNFYFVDQTEFVEALNSASLANIQINDRTAAFTAFSKLGVQQVENELKESIVSKLGQAGYDAFLHWTRIRYVGLADGGLLQQHFRAEST